MAELKDRIHHDLTAAMRAHDEVTRDTLRMVLTSITNAEVAGSTARELSDDEVIGVLTGEAKRRREAATSYDDAGAADRASRERAELTVIERYLPAPLSEDDLRALVAAAVAEAGPERGMAAMGSVMKVLQPQTRGRADGAVVAAMVKAALTGS